MKTLLTAVNAKYIHTNLAVRLISAFTGAEFAEYTINEPKQTVISALYAHHADVYIFSCYIWNIEFILAVAESLKTVSGAKIILGGPEVSFNYEDILKKHSFVDACIFGEGEQAVNELMKRDFDFKNVAGVCYRDGGIITNPPGEFMDINAVPFPYTGEEIDSLSGRLIYYETARGCPFNCSYCMSSTFKGVRFRDTSKVKEEMKFFIDHKVKIVKVVDRTFNANPDRTYDIFNFLIKNAGETTFHFEIAAHIFTERIFELIKTAPKGLFQFEIGVQTTNPDTIGAINRTTDFERVSSSVRRIMDCENIHVHLDLIAGLPFETLSSFKKSFNDVFYLGADVLQLGFLKLLYGTKIRAEQETHGYRYASYPPYEVLENKYITYSELSELKNVEEILEKYHNSGIFKKSLSFLLESYSKPYDMFLDIAGYFEEKHFFEVSHSRNALFDILSAFAKSRNLGEVFFDLLKFDYLSSGAQSTPAWSLTPYNETLNKKRFEIIKENPGLFPEFSGISAKEIIKNVHFEEFLYDISDSHSKEKNILAFVKNGRVIKISDF